MQYLTPPEAIYDQEVIEHHRGFIARRRSLRPSAEYREPTDAEWDDFIGHFAQRKVELLGRGRVVRSVDGDVVAAIELHRLKGISFWDALIVHAARLAGAAVLYTEDLQHGAILGGVRVMNPFLENVSL